MTTKRNHAKGHKLKVVREGITLLMLAVKACVGLMNLFTMVRDVLA